MREMTFKKRKIISQVKKATNLSWNQTQGNYRIALYKQAYNFLLFLLNLTLWQHQQGIGHIFELSGSALHMLIKKKHSYCSEDALAKKDARYRQKVEVMEVKDDKKKSLTTERTL
jgi:hypothetical protein